MENMRTLWFKLCGKPFSLEFFEVLDVKNYIMRIIMDVHEIVRLVIRAGFHFRRCSMKTWIEPGCLTTKT